MLSATTDARSARFSYTQLTASPNPDLRGSLSGHGAVDFATGDARVSEVEHDITFSSTGNQPLHPSPTTSTMHAIVARGSVYQASPIPGVGFSEKYFRLPFPTPPRSQRGLSLALNASVALDSLRGPYEVASITDLGPVHIDGVSTTQYEVRYEPRHICVPHQGSRVLTQRPSRVWIDGAGRIARVQSTLYFNDRLPKGVKIPAALNGFPRGPTTTIATLTFFNFGAPVHISVPPATEILSQGHSSGGRIVLHSATCRS